MHKQPCWLAVLTSIKQESASCVVQYGRPCRRNPTDEPYAAFRRNHIYALIVPSTESGLLGSPRAAFICTDLDVEQIAFIMSWMVHGWAGLPLGILYFYLFFFFFWADTMSAPLVPFSVRVYFNFCSDIRGRRRCVLVSLNQKEAQMLMLLT